MHCCGVLLREVYYLIVLGLGIIVVFFVTSLQTCYSPAGQVLGKRPDEL